MSHVETDHYRLIFEAVNDGILIADMHSETVLDANPKMAELAGMPLSGLVGARIGTLLGGGVFPEEHGVAVAHFRDGRSERQLKRGDGSVVPVEISVGPLSSGKRKLAAVIVRSIIKGLDAASELEFAHTLLSTISSAQTNYISDASLKNLFGDVLENILSLTGSEYGFVGDVPRTLEGVPYLKIRALSASAWKKMTRDFYAANAPIGMEFYNLDSLLCAPIKEQQVVIANDVCDDQRTRGIPPGHPPLDNFMGLPIFSKGDIVGVIGLANRAGGYSLELADYLDPLLHTCGTLIETYNNNRWREEAESRLHRQSLVYENISDGVILTDTDGHILDCNPAIVKIFGFSRREMQGAPISFMLGGGVGGRGGSVLETINQQGRWNEILTIAHRGGGEIVCKVFAFPLKGHGEDGSTLIWLIHDITERVAAMRNLESRTIELDAILKLSPDGFVFIDRYDRVAYLNPAFCQMTGFDASDIIGGDREAFEYALEGLMGKDAAASPHLRPHQDGADILMLYTPHFTTLRRVTRLLESERGELQGMVQCYQDITKETEIDRMKSQFLSTAAHELRTPMASVFGFSELLLKRQFDAERSREFIEIIHRQVGNLITLLNELLDIARIEARAGRDFKIASHDLNAIIRNTLDELMMPGDPRQVVLDLPQQTAEVEVDPEKMRLVLTNVLSNAYKYSRRDSTIELTLRRRMHNGKAQIGVAVRDQGIGMTAEQKSRVFDRFYRAESSGKIPGTGLGLSLVKEIMDIFKGETEIDSVPGKGTEVILWLPTGEKRP